MHLSRHRLHTHAHILRCKLCMPFSSRCLSDGNHTLAAAVIVEDNTKQHCSSKAGQDCGPRSDEEAKKLTHPTSRHCLDCQGMVHGYVGVWSVKLHGSISCGMHAPQASVSVVHTGLPPSRQAVPC